MRPLGLSFVYPSDFCSCFPKWKGSILWEVVSGGERSPHRRHLRNHRVWHNRPRLFARTQKWVTSPQHLVGMAAAPKFQAIDPLNCQLLERQGMIIK